MTPGPFVLALDDVCVRHANAPALALESVSLCVAAGGVVVLVGANGAGKSTLLRVSAGLLEPTSGTVRIGGVRTRELPRRAVARKVAFVSQNEPVPSGFRVREVVAMGRAPHQTGWMLESPADREAIDDAMNRAELEPLSDRRLETLSGGEQRRVAVARALAQRPSLLLLDEPAANLDVRHRLELHEALARIASRDGIACVVATHDLDAASRFASRVVLLARGRVAADGSPDEVLTPARLCAALGAEVDVGVHGPSGTRYFVPLRSRGPVKAPD
jgi:iron complex transport system ATP-binding protein